MMFEFKRNNIVNNIDVRQMIARMKCDPGVKNPGYFDFFNLWFINCPDISWKWEYPHQIDKLVLDSL